jgi:hypothetical protein
MAAESGTGLGGAVSIRDFTQMDSVAQLQGSLEDHVPLGDGRLYGCL